MNKGIALIGAVMLATATVSAQTISGSIESGFGALFGKDALVARPTVSTLGLSGVIGPMDAPSGRYSLSVKTDFDPISSSIGLLPSEAWVRVPLGPLDLSVGTQTLAWGSTDLFTPVDVANARDLSLPVDPAKLPVLMARVQGSFNWFSFDLVAEPFWTADRLPDASWLPAAPSMPSGITIAGIRTVDAKPGSTWEEAQFGARIAASLGLFQGFDLGLSGFRGRKGTPVPGSRLVPADAPLSFDLTTTLNYERFNLLGLDAVLALDGGILMKAAIGYTTLGDTPLLAPGPGLASAEGVAGIEYGIGALRLGGEYCYDWSKGVVGKSDTLANSLAMTIGAEMEGRLSWKLVGIYRDDQSGLVSPQVSYTVADGLAAELKAYYFLGDSPSTYGQWRSNSMGVIIIKYQF